MVTMETARAYQTIDTVGLYRTFAGNSERIRAISEAEERYRKVEKGEMSFQLAREQLDAEGLKPFLTQPSPKLDSKTPLQVLRDCVRADLAREKMDKAKVQVASPVAVSPERQRAKKNGHAVLPQGFSSVVFERKMTDQTITVISQKSEIGIGSEITICPNVKVIHVANVYLMNTECIKRILRIYPNLEVIESSPYFIDRFSGNRFIAKILKDHGVSLQEGRIREATNYDDNQNDCGYKEKKELFDAKMDDSLWRSQFQKMIDNGFIEAKLALIYLGEKKISYREIADRLNLKRRAVELILEGFCAWMGIGYENEKAKKTATSISKKLRRLEEVK